MTETAFLSATAAKLLEVAVPTEVLAELYLRRHRLLPWRKITRFRKINDCWRLGQLLLTVDGKLYVGGKSVRAARRERLGYVAESQEKRRDLAGFAYLSGFAAGTQLNFDATAVTDFVCNSAPALQPSAFLAKRNGDTVVLWASGADPLTAPTLKAYIEERVALLIAVGSKHKLDV